MDIAYFEVVAENGIVVDFKRGYACAFGLTLLYFKKIVFAVTGDASEFVQFRIHPGSNHIAFSEHCCCVRVDGILKCLKQFSTRVEALGEFFKRGASGLFAEFFDWQDLAQPAFYHQCTTGQDFSRSSP